MDDGEAPSESRIVGLFNTKNDLIVTTSRRCVCFLLTSTTTATLSDAPARVQVTVALPRFHTLRLVYWIKLPKFNRIDHHASCYGIADGTPPSRISACAYSSTYEKFVVGTLDGTIHSEKMTPTEYVGVELRVRGLN